MKIFLKIPFIYKNKFSYMHKRFKKIYIYSKVKTEKKIKETVDMKG